MLYAGSVVGTTFEPAKSNIPAVIAYFRSIVDSVGEIFPVLELKHNPLNPYDVNAVEVHLGFEGRIFFVGHIPKTHNKQLLEVGLGNVNTILDRFYFDDDGHPFGLAIAITQKEQA